MREKLARHRVASVRAIEAAGADLRAAVRPTYLLKLAVATES